MKILLIGGNVNGGILDNYARSFSILGHIVVTFNSQLVWSKIVRNIFTKVTYKVVPDFFFRNVNSELLRKAKSFNPDFILIFKGMEIFPDTITKLNKFSKVIANYNPDHPYKYFSIRSGNQNVYNSIKKYQLHFSYSRNIVKKLKKDDCDAYWLPFGFDNQIELKSLNNLSWRNKYMFIGSADKRRSDLLSEIALRTDHLFVFGGSEWYGFIKNKPALIKCFQGKSLEGIDYISATRIAYGNINFLRPQNLMEKSHNMRTIEVGGYGGFLLSERTEEQLELFEEDTEAVYFSEIMELLDKMNFYKRHPSSVDKIKSASRERAIKSGYDYLSHSKRILKTLQENYSIK